MSSYYTGAVASFAELLTQLVNACSANGWSYESGVLHKNAAYVRPYVSTAETSTEGAGLLVELGTGRSGSAVTGASGCIPRLGRPGSGVDAVAFPATFHIFVFSEPDEVFVVLQFNLSRCYFLAFGASAVGNRVWVTATSRRGWVSSPGATSRFSISAAAGGNTNASNTSGLLFWKSYSNAATAALQSETIRSQLDGDWGGLTSSTNVGFLNAIIGATPMLQRMPSAWNQADILMPIDVYQRRPENFWSLALSVRNARYLRIDNYELGQTIELGHERWMVFPGYRKDIEQRDGDFLGVTHTGTMGWCIRLPDVAEEED